MTIPTPIVDKNGKKTTVHKKAYEAPAAKRAVPDVGSNASYETGSYIPTVGISGADMDKAVRGVTVEQRHELTLQFNDHLYNSYGSGQYGTQSHRDIYAYAHGLNRTANHEGLERAFAEVSGIVVDMLNDRNNPSDEKFAALVNKVRSNEGYTP